MLLPRGPDGHWEPPSETEPRRTLAKGMSERQWERYRLSIVEEWPESPFKDAVMAAIEHKLKGLDRRPAWPPEEDCPLAQPSNRTPASRAAGAAL